MDKKTKPGYMLSIRDSPQSKRYTQTKSKGMEKDMMQMETKKKARVAILISDKIDFKTNAQIRDKEGHYILIKGAF